jgi:hypothetical protein
MSDDAPRRGASFSSAFSIILSLARERIAELGCPAVGDNPKAFVDRGGLSRLETEAAEDCDPRGTMRASRRLSACVVTGSGARRPNVEGSKLAGRY